MNNNINTIYNNSSKCGRKKSYDNYYLSITDNDTGVMKEMYLNEKEYRILDIAVRHNRGIINLLGKENREIIYCLFRKGLITISNDGLDLATVSDVISCILDPKAVADFSENPFSEENKPNGFFKLLGNQSICFCCL